MASKAQSNNSTENHNKNTFVLLLISLLFIAASAFAYVQLTKDENLPIRAIKVSGKFENVEPELLNRVLNTDVKGNFFALNVEQLYESLMALEWVSQVWIHRVWPDQLSIDLQEQVPVAVVAKKGLLNASGAIFTKDIGAYENKLPRFKVTDKYYKQAIDAYQVLSGTLLNYGFSAKEFVFDDRKSQVVVLGNGVKIVLGRHDAEKRFIRFMRAFANDIRLRKDEIKRVDLRFTNGFAVSQLDLRNGLQLIEVNWA